MQVNGQYKVIRLGESNGQDILDEQLKGLIPFTPLMMVPEGVEPEEWIKHILDRIEEIQHLKQLLRLAASAESLTKFKENLEE